MQRIDARSDLIRAKVSRITSGGGGTPCRRQLIASRRLLIRPASHLIAAERFLIAP
jgi:hypothetical protein